MTTTRTQCPTPPNRSRAFLRARIGTGFSLIEIVLVLAILAVLSAIAMPRLSNSMARQRAQSAAKRVAADIEFARSAAIAKSAGRKVVFSPSKGAYVVPNAPDPLNPANSLQYLVRLSQSPYQAKIAAVSFGDDTGRSLGATFGTAPVSEVCFDGFGTPDTTGWVTVQSGDFLYKVSVDAAGRTSIAPVTRTAVDLDITLDANSVVANVQEK